MGQAISSQPQSIKHKNGKTFEKQNMTEIALRQESNQRYGCHNHCLNL
jgi:hypothetical protein